MVSVFFRLVSVILFIIVSFLTISSRLTIKYELLCWRFLSIFCLIVILLHTIFDSASLSFIIYYILCFVFCSFSAKRCYKTKKIFDSYQRYLEEKSLREHFANCSPEDIVDAEYREIS